MTSVVLGGFSNPCQLLLIHFQRCFSGTCVDYPVAVRFPTSVVIGSVIDVKYCRV